MCRSHRKVAMVVASHNYIKGKSGSSTEPVINGIHNDINCLFSSTDNEKCGSSGALYL